MSKVTLPKRVAHNIEMLRLVNESNADIIRIALSVRGDMSPDLRDFARSESNLCTLIDALAIGYEVEKTDEELEAEGREAVRRYYRATRLKYEMRRRDYDKIPLTFYEGEITGIESTLDILGIQIEGVNA
jgi:hypothetical protein